MCSSGTCARFNSKLVRLEGTKLSSFKSNLASFNSKLVRLEVNEPENNLKSVFQFQTGSIRSLAVDRSGLSQNGFNSKLVRLEVSSSNRGTLSQL